jgi:hypothetical protein
MIEVTIPGLAIAIGVVVVVLLASVVVVEAGDSPKGDPMTRRDLLWWGVGAVAMLVALVTIDVARGLVWRDNGARPGDPSWGGR